MPDCDIVDLIVVNLSLALRQYVSESEYREREGSWSQNMI
jgi:hypothetical protein